MRAATVSGGRQCLWRVSMTTDSSLVTVATVMFGSCDVLLWQPSMGRTLEILGIESHSRRPGTVQCVCVCVCVCVCIYA